MDASANAPQWPLKAILYATDFSACSENAGNYASLLARKLDVDLLVAHAFILTQFAMEVEAESRQPAKSAQRKDLEATIAATAGRVGQGVKRAVPVLLEGDPREAIPRAAAEHAPSLIVLGTRGRGRMERSIVGSVAERILRAAGGPSLTVGPHVPVCEPGSTPFRRVLYATGLSPEAARGATYAVAMAQAFDASLDVLHVVNPADQRIRAGSAKYRSSSMKWLTTWFRGTPMPFATRTASSRPAPRIRAFLSTCASFTPICLSSPSARARTSGCNRGCRARFTSSPTRPVR